MLKEAIESEDDDKIEGQQLIVTLHNYFDAPQPDDVDGELNEQLWNSCRWYKRCARLSIPLLFSARLKKVF